jgi:AcrR family transcriptional regulator
MEYEQVNTKKALLLAAGELFAKNGLEATTTRSIAEKANSNIGCIHYHFGNKKDLYLAVFKYVVGAGKEKTFDEIMEKNSELKNTSEGLTEILAMFVMCELDWMFVEEELQWKVNLIVQEMIEPSEILEKVIKEFFEPKKKVLIDFYMLINPDVAESDADVWANMLPANSVFYLLAKKGILLSQERNDYSGSFKLSVLKNVTKTLALSAGLPYSEEIFNKAMERYSKC